jgi:transposase
MRTQGSASELEARRRIAGRLLLKRKKVAEVADLVGASWSAVKRWKTAVDAGGLDALAAKPHPGKRCRLTARQKEQLVKVLTRGPLQSGYANELWTCARVAEVIERRFGVSYHVDHVWRLLARLGWSSQKPEQRARERDEAAIAHWRRYQWPRIKKSGVSAKSSGFSRWKWVHAATSSPPHVGTSGSDTHSSCLGSAWSPFGHWCSVRFAETLTPRILFPSLARKHVHRWLGIVSGGDAQVFPPPGHLGLGSLQRASFGRPANAKTHPDWFDFEWLPAYAPELNPVEQAWNHTKYADLVNFIPKHVQHLEKAVASAMTKQSRNQKLLRSFFKYAKLPL